MSFREFSYVFRSEGGVNRRKIYSDLPQWTREKWRSMMNVPYYGPEFGVPSLGNSELYLLGFKI